MYRGSRKHVLDWLAQPSFLPELLALAEPVTARVSSKSQWMPRSYREPDEARLETFGPKWLPNHPAWNAIRKWWLLHEHGANTPNWDIAVGCEIDGRPGLVLVEAKANKTELKVEGKSLNADATAKSKANDGHIRAAVDEACRGLRCLGPDLTITCDSHYQLANRLAFTWKLATLGIPTVLIYLGFYGDIGIADAGPPFKDGEDWSQTFKDHAATAQCAPLFEKRLDCGAAPAWMLVRAKRVLEVSPAAH